MVSALNPVSQTVAASRLQPQAAASGNDGAQPSAAPGDIDPAVVNHVSRKGSTEESGDKPAAPNQVDDAKEAEVVRKMQARDTEVRAHERAHAATAGALGGAPSYTFERGPDGRSYAVSGEVSIDVSAVSDDPQATIRKMQLVKRAALAPASPSDADRAIAATADAQILAAQRELLDVSKKEPEERSVSGSADAANAGDAARTTFGSHERRNAGAAMYHAGSAPAPGNILDVTS